MHFDGLQKTTLLDYPGKVACTLFFGGCNFRCPFCHNASLVLAPERTMDEVEILSYLNKRRGILDGVCVTGGEPLLQQELPEFLRKVRALGFAIKLDTNGAFPAALKSIVAAGLVDYVAMDIKNSRERYGETAGVEDFDIAPIDESVAFLRADAVDYEFRTTVVRELHKEADFIAIRDWIAGAKRYFLQNFTDSGDLIVQGLSAWDPSALERFRALCAQTIAQVELRGV